VGSLGIVPRVSDDAITSPEYQVWRLRKTGSDRPDGVMLPGYAAVLIRTPFFIDLVRVHRVGAVKQRLYVENLLEIPVPVLTLQEQESVAAARETALKRVDNAERRLLETESEVNKLIVGVNTLDLPSGA